MGSIQILLQCLSMICFGKKKSVKPLGEAKPSPGVVLDMDLMLTPCTGDFGGEFQLFKTQHKLSDMSAQKRTRAVDQTRTTPCFNGAPERPPVRSPRSPLGRRGA